MLLTISMIDTRKEESETWILRNIAHAVNSILPKHMNLRRKKGKMFNLIGSL